MSFKLLRGVSSLFTAASLIVISVVIAVALYAVLPGFISQLYSSSSRAGSEFLVIDGLTKLPSGGLMIYVRNLGSTGVKIREVYIDDPYGRVILAYHCNAYVPPKEVSKVIVPSIYLTKAVGRGLRKVRVKIVSEAGGIAYSLETPEIRLASSSTVYLALKAVRYDERKTHWVIFNYVTGKYFLYDNTSGVVKGPYVGVAPILNRVDEYTITNSWVDWSNRPVDSPIVIVVNPTGGEQDWVFTWHAAGRTSKFLLRKLAGFKEADFLVFWEDLFNPYHPRSLDDWMDHVIRVTLFTNGTYRIAVYVAKGGYSHEFYLYVTSSLPLKGDLIYRKPFRAYWWFRSGGYYLEMPSKVFLVGKS